MTREELKEHCKKQIEMCEMWAKVKGEEPCGKVYEEHKMILELLEQEPCEDCVSRADVKEQMLRYGFHAPDMTVTEFVEDLPSVTSQPKTGRWILSGGYWRCSRCKEKALLKFDKSKGGCKEYMPVKSNYCPNCEAKMQEVEE